MVSLLWSLRRVLARPTNERDRLTQHICEAAAELMAYRDELGRELADFDRSPGEAISDPRQPENLGWINYWSRARCEFLGFPDPVRDQQLLNYSHVTATGAWMVKLCEEPLDLQRPDHLRIYIDAMERFPMLGNRTGGIEPVHALSYPHHTVFIQCEDSQKVHAILRCVLQADDYVEGAPGVAAPRSESVQFAIFLALKVGLSSNLRLRIFCKGGERTTTSRVLWKCANCWDAWAEWQVLIAMRK